MQTVVGHFRLRRRGGLTADYAGSFVFRPGAGGGTQPDMRHSNPSIRLSCSKRVRLQVMIAPVAANSARRWRTFASGTPVSLASSESRRWPYFLRQGRISFKAGTGGRGGHSNRPPIYVPGPRDHEHRLPGPADAIKTLDTRT